MPALVPLALTALAGCRPIGPAPADLDGLLHYLWDAYEVGEDEQVAEAARNLHAAVGGDALAGEQDGTLTDLTPEQVALTGRDDADPARAQGLVLVRPFDCALAALEPLLYDLDQDALHPDAYDSYERRYTSSLDDYLARATPALSWHVDYAATVIGASYTAALEGGLRYIPDLGTETSPWGPLLLARTWMPAAAVFEEGADRSLVQDYQIELFYERAPGEILHAYGLWREVDFGVLGTLEDEAVQGVVLNALSDWDDEVAALCGG